MSQTATTLPAKIDGQLTPELKTKLDGLLKTIPPDRQLSWLQLSNVKMNAVAKMEAEILKVQPLLKDYEKMDVVALQKAIDAFKAGLKPLPDIRMSFTKYLDKISTDMMAIQKRAWGERLSDAGRWEPIPDFVLPKAEARLIKLKEAEEEKNNFAANRIKELADFKAFVANGYIKIQTEYEKALFKTITDGYTMALKQELTEDGLKQFVTVTEAAMKEIKKIDPEKYSFRYWKKEVPADADDKTKAECKADLDKIIETMKSVPAPNYKAILESAIIKMKEQFQLYWQDKGTGDAGLDFISNKAEEFERSIDRVASEKIAVNTLQARGAAATGVINNPEVKPLKRKYVIEIEENNPAWANTVLTHFLANWNVCAPKLKIKNWGNLSVKQMAAALQELEGGEQLEGLKYTEVKK